MKKTLLLCGLLAYGLSLNAQERLVLYEEFTGENCPPCASTNPPLDQLMDQHEDKIIKIQYQVPIPSAGPIYNQYKNEPNTRRSYYGVNFAPWGQMDGQLPPGLPASQSNPAHPGYVVQLGPNCIISAQAVPTPFSVEISSYEINSIGELNATVKVTSSSTFTGQNMKLRAVITETLNFTTAPGTNGETYFPNVVRKMFPSPAGQDIAASWSGNQTETYQISGVVPSYVNLEENATKFVVWVQSDADKKVYQSAFINSDEPAGISDLNLVQGSLELYPNPVTDHLQLNLTTEKAGNLNFDIINISGQKVSKSVKNLPAGKQQISLSTESLAPGIYFLKVGSGANAIQRKFVKQ